MTRSGIEALSPRLDPGEIAPTVRELKSTEHCSCDIYLPSIGVSTTITTSLEEFSPKPAPFRALTCSNVL